MRPENALLAYARAVFSPVLISSSKIRHVDSDPFLTLLMKGKNHEYQTDQRHNTHNGLPG